MIRWQWRPERPIFIDTETQSASDLRRVGQSLYFADPTTRLLSAVASIDGEMVVWIPKGRAPAAILDMRLRDIWPKEWPERPISLHVGEHPPEAMQQAVADGRTFVAHNASFDATAWRVCVGGDQPVWYDTLPAARSNGYPGSLDVLGKLLVGTGKDEEGKRALKLLYKAGVVGTVPLWQKMLRYNVADVLLLESVYYRCPMHEPELVDVHTRINERGCPVNRDFARKLLTCWEEAQKRAAVYVASETDIDEEDVRSVPKMRGWLARQGVRLDTLNRQTLELLYNDPDGFLGAAPDNVAAIIAVLRMRQIACRATKGKVARLLSPGTIDDDNRVRDWAVYHGAHTGRFSSRKVQFHNMARSKIDVTPLLSDLSFERVAAEAQRQGVSIDDALASLFRSLVCAPEGKVLIPVDYAGVEARGVAWVAGDDFALSIFADISRDIYCEMASRIFGREVTKKDKHARQIGKIVVLGCGYGMGHAKFDAFCKLSRADLAAAGVTAKECVDTYRKTFAPIARCWRHYQNAAYSAVREPGTRPRACRCDFEVASGFLVITLPSGRKLHYRNPRMEKRVPRWGGSPVDQLVYDHPHGYSSVLYGGLLTENIVQGLCRDLLADAMQRLDGEYPIVLHVHDEPVFEEWECKAEATLRHVAIEMSIPPAWASSFPLRVEGTYGRHYAKGGKPVEAMRGVIL